MELDWSASAREQVKGMKQEDRLHWNPKHHKEPKRPGKCTEQALSIQELCFIIRFLLRQ